MCVAVFRRLREWDPQAVFRRLREWDPQTRTIYLFPITLRILPTCASVVRGGGVRGGGEAYKLTRKALNVGVCGEGWGVGGVGIS